MSTNKKMVYTAICIAICVVFPLAFHAVPNAGNVFSPMHLPVLLCGLICGPVWGMVCGISGVLLSSVISGMPPMAVVPNMMIELAVYGLISGAMLKIVRTKSLYADLYISLVTAMLIGRVAGGFAKAFIFGATDYSLTAWASAYFITGIPGIIMSLALIPTIVFALSKANLISKRYE